jgi:hypothetical protein
MRLGGREGNLEVCVGLGAGIRRRNYSGIGGWAGLDLPALLFAHVGSNLDLASFISACATLLAGGATLVAVWIINYVYIARSSSHKAVLHR